jgi:hypothetical protein
MDPQGPIIDNIGRLIQAIADWGKEIVDWLIRLWHTVEARIDARFDALEWTVWKVILVVAVLVALHGWLTRPRKP